MNGNLEFLVVYRDLGFGLRLASFEMLGHVSGYGDISVPPKSPRILESSIRPP